MKYFMQLVKGDSLSDVPESALPDVISTLADDLFVSEAFKNSVKNSGEDIRRQVATDLLGLFFASKPEGALFVEIPSLPQAASPQPTPFASGSTVQVPSHSEEGKTYDVVIQGGRAVSCTCKGFEHRETCRHLREGERLFDAQRFGSER